MKTRSYSVRPEDYRKMKFLAEKKGMKVSQFLSKVISQAIENR